MKMVVMVSDYYNAAVAIFLFVVTRYLFWLFIFLVHQEGVLQKFRKTFSLRFYKKGSKESGSSDLGETLSDILGEDESLQHVPSASAASIAQMDAKEEESTEYKHR